MRSALALTHAQGLKREEAKLTADIRSAAAAGSAASLRILAQNMVRLRGNIQRLQVTRAGLQGVGSSLAATAATATMAGSLQNAGAAMQKMGARVDPASTQHQMQQFSYQQDAAQSMIDDALDTALDGEDIEEGTQDVMQQLMDDIGVELTATLGSVPATRPQATQQAAAVVSRPVAADDEDELMQKLSALGA